MSLSFEPRSVRLFWSRLGSTIIGALLVFAIWFSFFPRPENVMPSEINLSVNPSTQAWIKTLSKNGAGEVLLPKGTLLSCSSDLKNQHCKTAAIVAPPSK